jgi:hypothetical protein
MTLAPMYEAIKRETSGKPSIMETLLSYWALDIGVRMVHYLKCYVCESVLAAYKDSNWLNWSR